MVLAEGAKNRKIVQHFTEFRLGTNENLYYKSTAKRVEFTALGLCAIENRKCLFLKSVFRTVKNAYEKALENGFRRAFLALQKLC